MSSPARRQDQEPDPHVTGDRAPLSLSDLTRYARWLGLRPAEICRQALYTAIRTKLILLGDKEPSVSGRVRSWLGHY